MSTGQIQLQCAKCDAVIPHTQETTSHVVHLLLTLFTAGLWLIAWIVIAVSNTDGGIATCTKCGNRRQPTGPATIAAVPVVAQAQPQKEMSTVGKLIMAATCIGLLVAGILYGKYLSNR